MSEEGLESDARFPSCRWVGYYQQFSRRFPTECYLTFRSGRISGEGEDIVGPYVINGNYEIESGKCSWLKQYIGQHAVNYSGYNEGKGIWGNWDAYFGRDGFHIWPENAATANETETVERSTEPIEDQQSFLPELEPALS